MPVSSLNSTVARWPRRAGPGGRVVQFAGPLLGVVDQLLHGLGRKIRRHHQHVLRGADQHHRLEVAHRIEALVRRDGDVHRQRLRAEMQRVAVGRRLRGLRRADIAAGAGAVLDHDLLAPHLAELRGDDARQRIERAAGPEGDDHADGFVRPSL